MPRTFGSHGSHVWLAGSHIGHTPVFQQTLRHGFIYLFIYFYCYVHGNRLPMDKSASTSSLYSNVVKGDTGFEESPTWLRKYQQEDEEDALKRAIEESVVGKES